MTRKLQLAFVILLVIIGLPLTGCGGAPKTKTYAIGVLNPSLNQEDTVKGFKEGMTELGYVEGKNIAYIYDGPVNVDQLDVVAQSLVKAKVNLILAITTSATKAAQKATADTDIAVVFIPVTDPVGAGVVTSLTKPGGNTTGVTTAIQEGKRLEWLLQVAPGIKQIYIPYNPRDPSPVLALKTVSETAAKLDVELITREVLTTDEAMTAFKNIPREADAIFFLPDSVVNARGADSYKLAIELGLPTSGPNVATVNDGALTAYGVDLTIAARQQAARLASQILQGTKPADLPVETTRLFAAINLKTAQAIGLDIPDDILRQANVIIR
ncbi:MAG TPA: ABC transporter substrate-binding protein [Anaerolineales bacterium]|nr:ABC transporter substrate-binding protein [Anaerolineales bacterium]